MRDLRGDVLEWLEDVIAEVPDELLEETAAKIARALDLDDVTGPGPIPYTVTAAGRQAVSR